MSEDSIGIDAATGRGRDLSSLTADQLAEKVREVLPRRVEWEDGEHIREAVSVLSSPEAVAALAELQTRANQRDNLAGLEELLAQTEERVRLLKIYALATEKERDEALGRRHRAEERQHRAEARLAETLKALRPFKTVADTFDGAAALTDAEFGRLRGRLWPLILDARTALTTHPADE